MENDQKNYSLASRVEAKHVEEIFSDDDLESHDCGSRFLSSIPQGQLVGHSLDPEPIEIGCCLICSRPTLDFVELLGLIICLECRGGCNVND